MTKKEKEEKLENFRTWVAFIDDRVNDWRKKLPENIAKQFDWSLKSLDRMEQYILSNYTHENVLLQENKEAIDAMASYIGETFRLNLPNAKWYIELDDEKNIFFNKPTVVTQIGAPISPFNLVMRIINDQSGDVLMRLYEAKKI